MVPLATFLGNTPLKEGSNIFCGSEKGIFGHFVMVPLNLTYLHCLQHSLFEHLFKLYYHLQHFCQCRVAVLKNRPGLAFLVSYITCTKIECFIHCGYHSLIEDLLYTQGLRTFLFLQMV